MSPEPTHTLEAVADSLIMQPEDPAEEVLVESADPDTAAEPPAEPLEQADPEPIEAQAPDEPDTGPDAEVVEEPVAQLYTVSVDGVQQQVTLEELTRGYSGQSYVKKGMQQNADIQRQLEAERQQIQQDVQNLQALRQRLESGQGVQPPTPPDPAMSNDNPVAYVQALGEYQKQVAEYNATQAQVQQLQQRESAEMARAHEYHLQQQAQILATKIPSFADPDKGKELRASLRNTGMEYGYSEAEVAGLTDARAVQVLHDAMMYRQAQAARQQAPKPVTPQPVVRPGAKRTAKSAKATQAQQARQKARRTGHIDDVAATLITGN